MDDENVLLLFSTMDFQLIVHVTNQIIAVPAVASIKTKDEIRFWHVWRAIDDVVFAVGCWLHLRIVSCCVFSIIYCSFGFVPRRFEIVGDRSLFRCNIIPIGSVIVVLYVQCVYTYVRSTVRT